MIGRIISHFKILSKLGQGGMGVVYKAEDTRLDRNVAIKFLPTFVADNETGKQRFVVEAKAAAALNHPNIATIYAIEETKHGPEQSGNGLFIVMEYIDGEELKAILARGLNPRVVTEYALQIAKGYRLRMTKASSIATSNQRTSWSPNPGRLKSWILVWRKSVTVKT